MSIFSQLINGKLTFSQAVTQGEAWFSTLLAKAPPGVQADVANGLSSFKQAASNAIAIADTALGPILATATLAVEAAANTALDSATAGAAVPLNPAVDAGISSVINALHAELDATAAKYRAQLASPPALQSAPVPQAA